MKHCVVRILVATLIMCNINKIACCGAVYSEALCSQNDG